MDDVSRTRRFVELSLDKHDWSPSPLLGQVVLVTSVNAHGVIDVAPKSWVSMAAFAGPIVGFGCNVEHGTHRNIESTGEFVINVPDGSLAERTWNMVGSHRDERITESGLTLQRGRTVAVPFVVECPAHLECHHYQTVAFSGGEVFIFGTISSIAVEEACLTAELSERYSALNPFFFLEGGSYATLGEPHQATHPEQDG
jgi:flavin reductase (DIM6/NTAB) family NADH-FMN oxidoreductase RutF